MECCDTIKWLNFDGSVYKLYITVKMYQLRLRKVLRVSSTSTPLWTASAYVSKLSLSNTSTLVMKSRVFLMQVFAQQERIVRSGQMAD